MRVHMDGVWLERVTGTPPAAAYGDHLALAMDAEEFSASARRLRVESDATSKWRVAIQACTSAMKTTMCSSSMVCRVEPKG